MTFLLECALRAAGILAVALCAVSLLGKKSAALRHCILAGAMLCAAAAPAVTLVMPEWNVQSRLIIPSSPRRGARAIKSLEGEGGVVRKSESEIEFLTTPSAPLRKRDILLTAQPPLLGGVGNSLPPAARIHYLPIAWGTGALLTLMILIAGWLRLAWIAGRAAPVLDSKWTRNVALIATGYGLRRRIRLLQSPEPAMLAPWGLFRPKVVLPSGADHWPEDRIQVVLRHELAHVRRHDWIIQTLAELLRVVYWFNPLMWIACTRLRRESELACDDTVITSGIPAADYAAHLLDLARTLKGPRNAWSPALSMARESTLEQRFKALLNPELSRRGLTRFGVAITIILLLAVSLPIAALHVSAQELESLQLPNSVLSVPAPLLALISKTVAPQGPAAASIEGVVLRYGSNDPLPDSTVELRPEGNPREAQTMIAGGDGRFSFLNLSPGTYRLIAGRPGGYVASEYGQSSPTGSGIPISLEAGQKLTNVRLTMAETGSISGHVVDRDGEPVARAQVQALRTVYPGANTLEDRAEMVVASVPTDDLGEYRLYWLPPGQYRVNAVPQDARRGWSPVVPSQPQRSGLYMMLTTSLISRRVLDTGEVQEEVQVPVYFPGASDSQSAAVIDVRPGSSVSGIDMTVLPPAATHHIRGVIIDGSTGQPAADVSVLALPLNRGGNVDTPNSRFNKNGAFEIAGLLPGSYMLSASAPGEDNLTSTAANLPVVVGDTDLENITIVISKGVDIPVTVTIDGQPPEKEGLGIRLVRYPFSFFMPLLGTGMIAGTPDWNLLTSSHFTLPGIKPGDYKFAFHAMGGPNTPISVYVKSARMGRLDVLNNLLHVDEAPAPIEIVIGTKTGSIEGKVLSETQEPASNAKVVLVPDAPYRGRGDLYKNVASDASGHFQITGIAPGSYRIFAWEDVQFGAWQDPEFISAYEGRGRPVHASESGRESVQLTAISTGK